APPAMQIVAALRQRLERLGAGVTSHVWRLGFASRFLAYLVVHSGTALRRFRLTIAEIYFAGVLSLIIILVSGLFVGMVLALQGYDTLQRFGASESLGVLVALSLVRELGPVVAGLLFASRAGSPITAESGLVKATVQLCAGEMVAVEPCGGRGGARWFPRRSPFSRSISYSPHSCSPEEVTDNEPLGYRSVGRNLRRGGPRGVAVSRAQGRQPRLLQHRAGLPGVCQVRQ